MQIWNYIKKGFSVVYVTKRRLSSAEHTDWSSVINHCISMRRGGGTLKTRSYFAWMSILWLWESIFYGSEPSYWRNRCSVVGRANRLTGWTVRSSNLCKSKRLFFSCPERQYRHRNPPILLLNGCQGLFPRLTRSGRKANHVPPSSAEVKNGWRKLDHFTFRLFNELGAFIFPSRNWRTTRPTVVKLVDNYDTEYVNI